jgi:spore maturation protein CgeB
MPKPRYESWFMEGKLKEGVHYIKVMDDFSDAEEKVAYYINHPDECLKIIENAHNYINQFKDKKRERLIQLLVLKNYFKLTGQYEN